MSAYSFQEKSPAYPLIFYPTLLLRGKSKKFELYVQLYPAPPLPRVTLYSQQRYFELGPQNPELS